MHLSPKALCACLVFLLFHQLQAQSPGDPSVWIQTQREHTAQNESVITLTLELENRSLQHWEGQLQASSSKDLKLISANNSKTVLKSGEKAYLPLKYYVGKNLGAGIYPIDFSLVDKQGRRIADAQTLLTVLPLNRVLLVPRETQLLLRQLGDSLRFSAQVINGGNMPETLKVQASFPSENTGTELLTQEIHLPAFADTVLHFSKRIDKSMFKLEFFNINIVATQRQNDFVGNVTISVHNASGDRKFRSADAYFDRISLSNLNRVQLIGRDLSGAHPAYNLILQQKLQLDQVSLLASVDATRWTDSNLDPMLINTYLDLEKNQYGLRVGTLAENDLEMNVSGRGAKFYQLSDDLSSFSSLGWVQKSYNLLDPNLDFKRQTAFANRQFAVTERLSWKSSLLWDREDQLNQALMMNQLLYKPSKKWNFDFKMGYGVAGARNDAAVVPYKPSLALSANWHGQLGAYQWTSNNFYSTDYYPGIRSGALISDQSVNRNLQKGYVWARASWYQYAPKSPYQYALYQNDNLQFRMDMGYQLPLKNGFKLSVSPQFIRESGRYFVMDLLRAKQIQYSVAAWNTTLNWSSKNYKHHLFVAADHGLAKYPAHLDWQGIYKIQANWSYSGLQLNTYYQSGQWMLAEGYSNSFSSASKLQKYGLTLSYSRAFWGDKLQIQVNSMYNRDTYAGNSYMYGGMIEWKAFKTTSLIASYNQNHYQYRSYASNYNYLQLGISQALAHGKLTLDRSATLEVFCFYDLNANGIYDADDVPAADRVADINGTLFISQIDGTIEYRKIPYGLYHVKLEGKKWLSKASTVEVSQKKVQLSIALQEAGIARGSLIYQYDSKTQEAISGQRSGIQLLFRRTGVEDLRFKTNERGEYTGYLPVGKYRVSIDKTSLPLHTYTEEEPWEVEVKKGDPSTLPVFIIKVKEKKFEVKRFGEP